MSTLIPRNSSSLTTGNIPAGFSRTEAKALSRQQNAEVTRGLVAAVRVEAAGFVATRAIQMSGLLSREVNFQAAGDEAAEARGNHIADQFAAYAGNEVANFRH